MVYLKGGEEALEPEQGGLPQIEVEKVRALGGGRGGGDIEGFQRHSYAFLDAFFQLCVDRSTSRLSLARVAMTMWSGGLGAGQNIPCAARQSCYPEKLALQAQQGQVHPMACGLTSRPAMFAKFGHQLGRCCDSQHGQARGHDVP